MKVLVVDDSTMIRMILKGVLKQLNLVDVHEALDGNAALVKLSEGGFGLMLLDLHMPGMSGLTLLEQVKTMDQHKDMPVIIISSDTDTETLALAQQHGASAIIKKPFKVEGLREALQGACPHALEVSERKI